MSHQLISRNPDLQRLRDEGYEIEVRSNLLLVHSVPYVNSLREVALGTIVSELTTASPGVLDKPGTHQVHFIVRRLSVSRRSEGFSLLLK
jgi:hypothetical protein